MTHDLMTVGIPLLAILAGILFNRSDVRELRFEVRDLRQDMQAGFDRVDTRFSRLEVHLDRIDADLRPFYHLTGKLEARMDALDK